MSGFVDKLAKVRKRNVGNKLPGCLCVVYDAAIILVGVSTPSVSVLKRFTILLQPKMVFIRGDRSLEDRSKTINCRSDKITELTH